MKKPLFSLAVAVLCSIVTACGSPAALAGTPAVPSTSAAPETTPGISTEVIPLPNDVIRTIDVGNMAWELDELIVASEAVVIGKVSKIPAPLRGTDDIPPHTSLAIYTDILVEVEEYLYGGSGAKTITIHMQSGRIGNEVVLINHGPVYREGETSLFFLYRSGMRPQPPSPAGISQADYYQTSGFGQGKWAYQKNTATYPDGRVFSTGLVKDRVDALRVKMSESYYQSTDFSKYRAYRGTQSDLNWPGMSTEDIIADSAVILVGEVVAIRPSERSSAWTKPQRQRLMEGIYTDVIIHPERLLKGETSPGDIAIRLPCGRLGDEVVSIGGYVTFELGQKTLLFLRRHAEDGLAPYLPLPRGISEANYGFDAVGGPQGQWTINGDWVRDRSNKEWALSDLIKLIG
jgi:hypothetical protein